MLPYPLPDITESVLEQICEEKWPETQTLEFKALLPLNDETARHEFRKDVCALANAEGGDLIYGISEKNGCANAVLPIAGSDFDGVKRRLKQILESQVEPRLHNIQFHHCMLANGGFVLLLRIPSSYDGPHRFGPAAAHRFTIRTDTSTSDMTYDQLRNAFGRGETLHQKAMQFRTERVDMIFHGNTPRPLASGVHLITHIIPICGLAGRAKVDIAALQASHDIFRLDVDHVWKRVANLAGLVMYPYDDGNGVEAYSQIFRNGAFEAVKDVATISRGQGGNQTVVLGVWVGNELRKYLSAYAKAAPQLAIGGPAVVSVSLTNTSGTSLLLNANSESRRIDDSRLDLPEVMVADIARDINLDEITQPILDVLYQCYGQPRCLLFDGEGVWRA